MGMVGVSHREERYIRGRSLMMSCRVKDYINIRTGASSSVASTLVKSMERELTCGPTVKFTRAISRMMNVAGTEPFTIRTVSRMLAPGRMERSTVTVITAGQTALSITSSIRRARCQGKAPWTLIRSICTL